MHCAEVKYYLSDYSRGILLDEVRTEIHAHLNDCSGCAKVFDTLISLTNATSVKKKSVRQNKRIWERVHKEQEGNSRAKKIVPRTFSASSRISSEVDHLKNSIMLKANEFENHKLFVTAGIVSIIAFGVILALILFDHSPTMFWSVEKISGYPVIESSVLNGQGIIKVGEKLYTDSESRARLKVGAIGELDIEPESIIEITETKTSEYRLVLSSGKISARTWVAPKLFSIKTPSAVITDLGCTYYLSVDDKASTTIQVKSGWMLVENKDSKSLLPAGTICISKISNEPGTPFSIDASTKFKESLHILNSEYRSTPELAHLLSEARPKDLITLFHLLKRLNQESRGMIYDQISLLFKMPQRVTRDGIVNGDNDMMGRLWTELGLGSISLYQYL